VSYTEFIEFIKGRDFADANNALSLSPAAESAAPPSFSSSASASASSSVSASQHGKPSRQQRGGMTGTDLQSVIDDAGDDDNNGNAEDNVPSPKSFRKAKKLGAAPPPAALSVAVPPAALVASPPKANSGAPMVEGGTADTTERENSVPSAQPLRAEKTVQAVKAGTAAVPAAVSVASPVASSLTEVEPAPKSPVSPLSSRGAAVPARSADFSVVCRRCQQEGATTAMPAAICSGSQLFRSNHYVCASIGDLRPDAIVVSSLQRPRQVRDIMISGKLSCATCRCPLGTVIALRDASNGAAKGSAKTDIGAAAGGVGTQMPCFKVREICLYDKLARTEEGEDPALLISGWSLCPWTLPLH
jgi:hypothetical protein